jgi:hypothetical protein
VIQHTKSEEVKVGRWLNETIWKRGSKNPPSRVRVDVKKEENYAIVELSELPRKASKTETKIEDKLPEKEKEKKVEKKEIKPKVKKPTVKKKTEKKSTSTKTKKK